MDGPERNPEPEEIANTQSPGTEAAAQVARPADEAAKAGALTLDLLASRIDGMGEWAKETQAQIRNLQQLTQSQAQLSAQLTSMQNLHEALAAHVAELGSADPSWQVDPAIGYQPTPEQQAQLFCALAEWQTTAKSLEKGRTAELQTRAGATATYRYVDIADVSEVARSAGAAGLAHFHRKLFINGRSFIRTYLVHKAGGWTYSDVPLSIRESTLTSAIQQWGAACTYARRYGLFMVLGIAAGDEDDDGASAGNRSAPRSSSSRPPARAQSAPQPTRSGSTYPARPPSP